MTMSDENSPKKYGLFAFGVLAFLSSVGVLIVGFNNTLALAFAGLMILVSVQLVRASNVYARGGHVGVSQGDAKFDGGKRIGPLAWTLGVVSAVAVGISLLYLYKDAANGYHGIVPVYAFAASTLVATVVWSYLFSKLRN